MMKQIILAVFVCVFLSQPSVFGQHGLKAEFFEGIDFGKKINSRTDGNIDFFWRDTPPMKGVNTNYFSARWTGRLLSPESGSVVFSARVDDGIRVWIDGKQIIDNWQLNDFGYSKGTFEMEAGKMYDLRVDYFNALNEGELTLQWKLPEIEEEKGWFDWLWADDEPKTISMGYFFQPVPVQEIEEKKQVDTPVSKKKSVAIAPKKETAEVVLPKEITTEIIQKYIPKNVQFEQAQTEILPASFEELDKLAEFLIQNQQHKIKIEGHTDNVGDAEKNFQLSHRRANAVAAYLIKKGVHFERLSAEGFGGSRPLKHSDGRKYHPENRRVEFIVE